MPYYTKALQVRTLVIRDYGAGDARNCDAILAPVAPTTAYKLGEKTASPLEMYLGDIYTVPVNIAGRSGAVPALRRGQPADCRSGVQLMGPTSSEPMLYRIGARGKAVSCTGERRAE